MRLRGIIYFLMLLVLSALADDVWAGIAFWPYGDNRATENDEFLPTLRQSVPVLQAPVDRQPPWSAPARTLVPTVWGAGFRTTGEAGPVPLSGPDLLYLLMSLQP